ncbi:hypothetical protein EDB85DRAFT_2146727 [Lactarius pseudohatsudake]|nr:hypothetical protein EDB85DRAFT_2146727 [Lactarius pseudohatsudake]
MISPLTCGPVVSSTSHYNDTNFNNTRTLILGARPPHITYADNNRILALLLGGTIPGSPHGTVDSTYYTHYSLVEANWGLGSQGRSDTNKVLSNIFSFIIDAMATQALKLVEWSQVIGNGRARLHAARNFAEVAAGVPNASGPSR